MTIHFRGELTRKVAPGNVVVLSGIFLPIPYTGFTAMRAGLVADTYLEAMSATNFKKKYEEVVHLRVPLRQSRHHFLCTCVFGRSFAMSQSCSGTQIELIRPRNIECREQGSSCIVSIDH